MIPSEDVQARRPNVPSCRGVLSRRQFLKGQTMKIIKTLIGGAAGALALTLAAAQPAAAQDDRAKDALIGAAIGAIGGALIGNGDQTYVLGGAAAGAAVGYAQANRGDNCSYYRGGRCYRNQGHWEREHGINSREPRYQQRRDYRDWQRNSRDDRRDRRDRRW